jgi:hypothetical protein
MTQKEENEITFLKQIIIQQRKDFHATAKKKRYNCYRLMAKYLQYTQRQDLPSNIEQIIKQAFPDEEP